MNVAVITLSKTQLLVLHIVQDDSSRQLDRSFSPMAKLIGGTLVTAFVEWLMLELLRTPYRPPADMLTFLGTEKYALVAVMIALAAVWLAVTVVVLTRTRFSIANYLVFTAVVAALAGSSGYIVGNPHRPVTPWDLLLS